MVVLVGRPRQRPPMICVFVKTRWARASCSSAPSRSTRSNMKRIPRRKLNRFLAETLGMPGAVQRRPARFLLWSRGCRLRRARGVSAFRMIPVRSNTPCRWWIGGKPFRAERFE